MTILAARGGKRPGSVEIFAITKDGEELVDMSDLCWKSGGMVGLPQHGTPALGIGLGP
jgi:hypothetical protein